MLKVLMFWLKTLNISYANFLFLSNVSQHLELKSGVNILHVMMNTSLCMISAESLYC